MRMLPDARGLPRDFWLLVVGTLIDRVGGFVTPFLAIYLTDQRRMAVGEAGLVVSLVGLGAIAAGPCGGMLADRMGRRFALGVSTMLGAAAMLALGMARSQGAVAAGALALGLFGEMYRPTVGAMVADLVPAPERPRAYGYLYWVVNVGFSLAPVLAGLLVGHGFTLLFVVDAATTAVFGALVFFFVKETRPPEGTAARARRPSPWTPYADGTFVAFAAVSTLLALVFFQGHVALPVDMRAHGISSRGFGLLIAVNGVLIVVLQPFVLSFVRKLPRGAVLAGSALLYGAGFGMTGLARGSAALYAAAIAVWTLGEIANAPLTPTIVSELAPAELRGSYQGAFQITFGAASFVAPAVGSLVLARCGSGFLWGACAVAGLIAAIGFLHVERAVRRRGVS